MAGVPNKLFTVGSALQHSRDLQQQAWEPWRIYLFLIECDFSVYDLFCQSYSFIINHKREAHPVWLKNLNQNHLIFQVFYFVIQIMHFAGACPKYVFPSHLENMIHRNFCWTAKLHSWRCVVAYTKTFQQPLIFQSFIISSVKKWSCSCSPELYYSVPSHTISWLSVLLRDTSTFKN